MNIASFDDLLSASRAQPVPQSLLMVFVDVELPPDSTPEQRERFDRGEGGALMPRMCVDRSPADIESWDALVKDADTQSDQWRMVMVAALAGMPGQPPTSDQIDGALNQMVMSIHQGQIQAFVPFDRQGQAIHFG